MFRRTHHGRQNHWNDDNPFLLSFSDLMASLLAIFILLLVVTLVELEKRKEDSKNQLVESLEEIQQTQNGIAKALTEISYREYSLSNMLSEIQKDLRRNGIEVIIAENGTVLRIPEKELHFALGRYDIPPSYASKTNALGKAILNVLSIPEKRKLLDTVFIEGHTDSVVNNREMGNWGLSTYRAISLWNFWTESPGQVAELKNLLTIPIDPEQHSKPLFSVSGYADTRSTHGPLEGKGLKDDRPEDRRIDIRFTLISSEKKSLQDLQEDAVKMQSRMKSLIENLKKTYNGN